MFRKRASEQGTRRGRKWGGIVVLGALLLAPALAAGWVMQVRQTETSALERARAAVERGELEAGLELLEEVRLRPMLSVSARREAARLLFRLGEDQKAHTLLLGQQIREGDPADQELQELSSRCQRAQAYLRHAEKAEDVGERLHQIRLAQLLVPEAPRLLERAAQEALLAYVQTNQPRYLEEFTQDYLELRRRAPGLAHQLKRRVADLLPNERI